MQRLSGLDSVFLNVETDSTPMHIGALMVVDPRHSPRFGFEAVRKMIEARLHLLPAFRRRVVAPPLNLIHQFWVEDPDFSINRHFRRTVVPGPGGNLELERLVAKLLEPRLDRSRPLWQWYYIEGLASGHVACLLKVHHACLDGVAGSELFSKVLDADADAPDPLPPPRAWIPDRIPSPTRLAWLTARSALAAPRQLVGLLRETRAALRAPTPVSRPLAEPEPAEGDVPAAPHLPVLAPRTCLNSMITPERSYAFGSLSMATVKKIKTAFNVSVNDVILAVCAEAVRRYLRKHHDLPKGPLLAAVPISLRRKEESGAGGNQVLMARVNMATDIVDPVERMLAISSRMHRVKRVKKSLPTKLLMDWINVPSPALLGRAAWLNEALGVQDFVNVPFNLVISNIPGPQVPLYLTGGKVLGIYPASIAYHGLGINITLMSYHDELDVGLTAHRYSVPDVDYFLRLMRRALSELRQRAESIAEQPVGAPV